MPQRKIKDKQNQRRIFMTFRNCTVIRQFSPRRENKHCEQISAIIGLKQMKRKHWPTEGGQWVLLLVFLPNVYPTQWHTIESGFSFLPINE